MATRGLTADELAALAQQLAEGKRPRVQVSGPHFPVATLGTLIRVGDPAIDGTDYLRVRVKVDNLTDELAFAPAELQLPGRRGRRTATAGSVRRSRSGPVAEPAAAAEPPRDTPAKAAAIEPAGGTPAKAAAAEPAGGTPAKAAAQPAKAASAAGRRRKTGGAPRVSLTISSNGASWSLVASRGSKHLIKPAELTPGTVTALAELLGQRAVSEAVAEINDVALAEAQARADELRAELSQLEAVLAAHRSPR